MKGQSVNKKLSDDGSKTGDKTTVTRLFSMVTRVTGLSLYET